MKSRAYQGFEVARTSWKMTAEMILFLSIAIWVIYSVGFYYLAPYIWPEYFHPLVLKTIKFWFVALWKAFLGLGLQLHKKYMVWTDGSERSLRWIFDHINVWVWFRRIGLRYGFYLVVTEAILLIPGVLYFRRKAKKINSPKHIRGARIVKPKQLNKRLKKKFGGGDIPLSKEIVLPQNLETRHCFIIGGTGTGKTTALNNIIYKLRERKEKAVIFDLKGDFLTKFYHQGDLILNPLDVRSVKWTLFNDLKSVRETTDLARSFIPAGSGNGTEQYFRDAARDVLAGIMAILLCKKELSNKRIWEVISLPNKKLLAFLKSHPEGAIAVSYIEKPDSNQAVGVKSTLLQLCRIFRELQNIDGKFSLRQWIRQDGSEFLFLPVPPEFRELLAPAYGAAINMMIRELLSLADDLCRRRFFILDELGALQRLSALVDALTLGRSKGMSIFIGVQDFGRIDDLYGKSVRETLWNNSTSKMILRVDSPHAAEFLAKSLGQSEVEESSQGHSMGVKDGRDGQSLSRQVHTRYALLPAEISSIQDLTAAIKIAGLDPAYPCRVVRQKIEPTGALAFDPLDDSDDPLEDDEIVENDEWVEINEPESSEEISEPAPHDDPDVDSKLCELCQGPKQEQPEKTESEDEDMQTQTFHPL